MKINSDFRDLLDCFNKEGVEYLLVGGYAVILHSEPRYTKDIDLWINPSEENARRVYAALLRFGAPLTQLNLSVADFSKEGFFVQFGREPSRIDILMSIKGLKFIDAWKRREVVQISELDVNVISRQDLICAKLEAGRPQDFIDAEALKKSKKG